ncbi:uncharacterized protein K441DRAFT_697969 [Cenococcum geophilum 1.58]|uniref:uncharacterized protein n=1 Tax=Cenococcum geophilum 1.58 TaxID=794803 RepID=UPI00358DE762|nr:hypothetical protein K441DRAFT_697969 [Cenococcum geophilum 1.58]
MSGPSLHISLPSWSLFKFPPDSAPPALPPLPDHHSFASPFAIPADLYNDLLSPAWPITIATVYAITVFSVNASNRKAGNKPWAISKTRLFRAFVIAHNVFLAVYSAITCAAMVQALRHTWSGASSQNGFVGAVDALCKMHGPRGLGDAAAYNPSTNLWEIKNGLIHLGANGSPDPTDVGRLWNEGLAFWGWFFYLSKFYEVLDTFIILAKGKRSSTLQTYHHAGAMLCMWAGIRFMSPPIWMFVLVNSGIHTLMYTYYTISALRFRVPQTIKRTLTTMQIAQFVVGVSFAAAHLFISYTVPVSTPYTLFKTISSTASATSSVASSAISQAVIATATANVGAFLKKLAYRAAGEEGLAENVRNNQGQVFGPEAERVVEAIQRETKYRNEYQEVPCIDTTGQSFAIWLNIIYLLPLTALFVRFFIRSYTHRTSTSTKHPTHHHAFSKAGKDAVHGEIESLGKSAEDGVSNFAEKAESTDMKRMREVAERLRRVQEKLERIRREPKETSSSTIRQSRSTYKESKDAVESFNEKVAKSLEETKLNGSASVEKAREVAADLANKDQDIPEHLQKKLEEALVEAQNDMHYTEEKGEQVKQEAEDTGNEAKEEIKENGKPTQTKSEKEDQPNDNAVKKEDDEDKENEQPVGLSTSNPSELDESYADILKRPDA